MDSMHFKIKRRHCINQILQILINTNYNISNMKEVKSPKTEIEKSLQRSYIPSQIPVRSSEHLEKIDALIRRIDHLLE